MHLEGMSSKEAFREVGKDLIREMASQCDLLVVFGGWHHVACGTIPCRLPDPFLASIRVGSDF